MLTILSGIFGGLLRLAPELFKWLNAKEDHKHELALQDKAIEFQRLRGSQKLDEIHAQGDADWNIGAISALKSAIEGQDKPSGIKWIDGLSKLIRPAITIQWVMILYPGVIVASFCLAVSNGENPLVALVQCFGETERAIVAFIIDFWFIGRILDKGRK
jgi:hypothetical protein